MERQLSEFIEKLHFREERVTLPRKRGFAILITTAIEEKTDPSHTYFDGRKKKKVQKRLLEAIKSCPNEDIMAHFEKTLDFIIDENLAFKISKSLIKM